VVTKSGANQIHGSAFEFLRNTDLDARNFFSPDRSFYRQNQFGGTVGGPIRKNKIFYFADYQGTRSNQGIDTGLIAVPSLAERTGNLSASPASSRRVSGPYIANLLRKSWATAFPASLITRPACSLQLSAFFPNAIIPRSAWSAPAQHLLQYIPQPNVGSIHSRPGRKERPRATTKEAFASTPIRTAGALFGLLFLSTTSR
jgi:hypothetical protein